MASGPSKCRTMSSTNGLEPEGFYNHIEGPRLKLGMGQCYFKQERTRRGALHITLCWSRCLPKDVTYWQEGPVIQPTNKIIVSRRKTFGLKNNEYSSMICSIEAFLTSQQRSTYRLVLHSCCPARIQLILDNWPLVLWNWRKPSCTSSTSLKSSIDLYRILLRILKRQGWGAWHRVKQSVSEPTPLSQPTIHEHV